MFFSSLDIVFLLYKKCLMGSYFFFFLIEFTAFTTDAAAVTFKVFAVSLNIYVCLYYSKSSASPIITFFLLHFLKVRGPVIGASAPAMAIPPIKVPIIFRITTQKLPM